ncbi:MAG: GNAT family N-acetyltransferase [Actinomycetota bacterium]|nr:GNAT family N-acetyltransferase [Actinomycetota bacterium]
MTGSDTTIRPIEPADCDAVLALNQSALDGVGPLDTNRLQWIVGLSDRALVADVDGDIGGFVITMPSGTAYDSPNYAWFEERFDNHCYLDRIVVAPTHRRMGIASQLYDEIERTLPVTLEVYAEPPNGPSLAFHAVRGYEEIGRLPQSNGKVVALFVKRAEP